MAFLGVYYIIPKIFAFLFLFLSNHTHAEIFPTQVSHKCQNGPLLSDQLNKLSITALLSDLVDHSSTATFYSSSSSASGPNETTYGLFYCTANVNSKDCNNCVKRAAGDARLNCPLYNGAVIFYEDCTLRYSDTEVRDTLDDSVVEYRYNTGVLSTVHENGFNETLYDTLNMVIVEAANSSKGYATREADLRETSRRLYTLAQCTPDIIGSSCKKCLDKALEEMPGCCDHDIFGVKKTMIMTFLPSCQLRYEVKYPWLNDGTASYSPGNIVWYIVVAVAVVAFGLH